jgi:hypothetical protein
MHTKKSFKAPRSIRRGGMKTSAFGIREIGRSGVERLLLVLAAVLALATAGCDEGHEGDRCVATLSHNDCASSDLVCGNGMGGPLPDCPETYCCPVSGMSSNPYCQPGCGGGALSIIFASCSTSTPNALCPCINNINGINEGPLSPDNYPTGVDCTCVAADDPIACLAAAADSGTPEAGGSSTDGPPAESSTTDGPPEGSSMMDSPSETSSTDGPPAESSTTDGSTDAPGQ